MAVVPPVKLDVTVVVFNVIVGGGRLGIASGMLAIIAALVWPQRQS